VRTFVVARNPDHESSLPYLVRLPVDGGDIILKTRETWPRSNRVYCHRATHWPEDVEVLEEVPVRRCARRGAAIDLVLDRRVRYRSQFVFTRIAGGREAIFWQTAATARAARPGVRMPTARASKRAALEVVVDTRERYPFKFPKRAVSLVRRALAAGDYAVERDGELVAVVERKTLDQIAGDLVDGSFGFQLAELAVAPAAAVVVEDRYSALFKLDHVRAGWVPELLAQAQARYSSIPIVFCETRALAEEWTYRYLAASAAGREREAEQLRAFVEGDEGEPRPMAFDRESLMVEGFEGWIRFADLPDADVPRGPGVYVVVRPDPVAPRRFTELSTAGWFKDRDPNVGIGDLERRWVLGAATVYIGKASNLRSRLDQYRRHGLGEPIGHWGGRFVWQLADASELLVAWRTVEGRDPAEVEADLLAAFEQRFGVLPFANLTRGRRKRA
jgi:hypothetical protein